MQKTIQQCQESFFNTILGEVLDNVYEPTRHEVTTQLTHAQRRARVRDQKVESNARGPYRRRRRVTIQIAVA